MQGQTSSYVITKLLAAPACSDLTTLATVRDELDIPSNDTSRDATLSRFIREESAAIGRHCNRVFGVATWQDEIRPQRGIWSEGTRGPSNPLKLAKWPLASGVIVFSGNTHSNRIIDQISSASDLKAGMPVFGPGVPVGARIDSATPVSVFLNTAVAASAAGVTLSAGLSVVETVAGVETMLTVDRDFSVDGGSLLPGDEGAACLYRLNEQGHPRTWPQTKIVVTYRAGYVLPGDETSAGPKLPSDLEGACVEIVVGRFRAKGRDPMLRSRSQAPHLGTEEYWVGALPGENGPYPNRIMAVLDRYRVPVVA